MTLNELAQQVYQETREKEIALRAASATRLSWAQWWAPSRFKPKLKAAEKEDYFGIDPAYQSSIGC